MEEKKKVLVIDDSSMMKSYVEKFCEGCEVSQIFRLPDGFSGLDEFDAVIVDGDGIGNATWENGFEFLMSYQKRDGQSVVYHSGYGAYGTDRDLLEAKGVAVVLKGGSPEKLAHAVRFPMEMKAQSKQGE